MAMNRVQFQSGLSLPAFLERFGTEAQCEDAVSRLRWPDGFCCPRCAHDVATPFRRHSTQYWQCKACGHQASLRAGTLMEQSNSAVKILA